MHSCLGLISPIVIWCFFTISLLLCILGVTFTELLQPRDRWWNDLSVDLIQKIGFDAGEVEVWGEKHAVGVEEGEEVAALGGGGDGGARVLEGGEVGEGLVY